MFCQHTLLSVFLLFSAYIAPFVSWGNTTMATLQDIIRMQSVLQDFVFRNNYLGLSRDLILSVRVIHKVAFRGRTYIYFSFFHFCLFLFFLSLSFSFFPLCWIFPLSYIVIIIYSLFRIRCMRCTSLTFSTHANVHSSCLCASPRAFVEVFQRSKIAIWRRPFFALCISLRPPYLLHQWSPFKGPFPALTLTSVTFTAGRGGAVCGNGGILPAYPTKAGLCYSGGVNHARGPLNQRQEMRGIVPYARETVIRRRGRQWLVYIKMWWQRDNKW